jgi:hypothetical protein
LNLSARLISHGTVFFSLTTKQHQLAYQPQKPSADANLGNRQIKLLSQQHEKDTPSKEANHCKLEHVCESNKIH